MKCIYELEITATCPVNLRVVDRYQCVIRSPQKIDVEQILHCVEAVTKKPAYQEDITLAIRNTLGCEVTTTGTHSGVLTTVVCN